MASWMGTFRSAKNWATSGLPPSLPQYLLPARVENYARSLYARLRELDRFAFDCVLIEAPPDDETWWAVNDRLARAAHGQPRRGRA